MTYKCSFCETSYDNSSDYEMHGFETCISCGGQFRHFYINPFFSKYQYFGFIRCFDDQDIELMNELFKRIPSLKTKHIKFIDGIDIYRYRKIVDLYGYYSGYLLSKVALPDGYLCEGCLKEFEWKNDIVHLVSKKS